MIQKGFLIFQSYIDVFRQSDLSALNGKYKTNIADQVVSLFKVCHSLLSLFCKDNSRHQDLLFQNFNLLTLITKVDIGQLSLINEILKGNHELALSITEKRLKVFCEFIVLHGKKEVFLNIFSTLIDHPTHDTANIQKKVLFVLLSEEYFDHINVIFSSSEI